MPHHHVFRIPLVISNRDLSIATSPRFCGFPLQTRPNSRKVSEGAFTTSQYSFSFGRVSRIAGGYLGLETAT